MLKHFLNRAVLFRRPALSNAVAMRSKVDCFCLLAPCNCFGELFPCEVHLAGIFEAKIGKGVHNSFSLKSSSLARSLALQ
ncbi:unnamed protein product [Ectocarpus sp. 12 AP-2014]